MCANMFQQTMNIILDQDFVTVEEMEENIDAIGDKTDPFWVKAAALFNTGMILDADRWNTEILDRCDLIFTRLFCKTEKRKTVLQMGYGDHTNKAFTDAYTKYRVAVVKSMRRWKYGKVDDPEKLEQLHRIGMGRATYFYIYRAAGRVSVSLPIFTATALQVFADSLKAINTGIAEVRKHYFIFISTLLRNGHVCFGGAQFLSLSPFRSTFSCLPKRTHPSWRAAKHNEYNIFC